MIDMNKFGEFIAQFDLIDLPLVGSCFTWSRNGSMSRIDRSHIFQEWEEHFLRLKQKVMVRPFSDHCF